MQAAGYTNYIQLNYNKYVIHDDTLTVTMETGETLDVASISRNNSMDQDLYLVELEKQLSPGDEIQVRVELAYSRLHFCPKIN